MKKPFRILLMIATAFTVLMIVSVITLKIMFPPEKVKEIIVKEISTQLKREVKLGEVKVGIFSGISVSDFALSESHTFKEGTFIQSNKFILKFQILPLLQKKVMIEEILLESPQIKIVQNADGKTFNFSDLISPSTETDKKPEPAPKETRKEETTPISLTVSKARISKGNVEFIDKSPRKIKAALNPIDLTVSATGLDKPMILDLSIGIESVIQKKNISGTLKTKSVLSLTNQTVQLDSLQWKMKGAALDIKGKVENFIKPKLTISLSIHDINLKELTDWITLPKEINIAGSPSINLDLKGDLDDLNISPRFDFSKVGLSYSDVFQKNTETEMSFDAKVNLKKQKDLRIDFFKIKIGGSELEAKGDIQNLTDPHLKVQVQSNSFDLKEIGRMTKLTVPYHLSGQLSLQANVSGILKLLKYKGSLKLENVQAKVEPYILESLNGSVGFDQNSVDIPKLSGKVSIPGKTPSEFKIKTSVTNFLKPEIILDADFSALDLGMFISETKEAKKSEAKKAESKSETEPAKAPYKGPEIKAEGKVTIGKVIYTKFEGQNAKMTWKLTGITPVLDKINGIAYFEMNQGKIHRIPLLNILSPILKTDPSGLVYTRIDGNWNISQGAAKTDDFKLLSPSLDAFVKGTLYLPTNKPDLILTAKLPKGSIGGTVGDFSSDEQGHPTFVFKIKNDWKPALDTSQVQKKAVEKATQEIKKKAADVLQNEGKKLLEGLFK